MDTSEKPNPGQPHAMPAKTVKDLDPDDQPRERAIRHGCGQLPTADLWALILRTGIPGKPVTELCRDIMRENCGLIHNLERRDRRELLKIKGLGITKVIQIEAVLELMRRYSAEVPGERPIIRSSEDIDSLMRPRIANLPHEEIWIVLLNRQNSVLSMRKISSGSAVATVFDIKSIIRHAILESAEGMILCHNHPSGNLTPSREDDLITAKCKLACETMEIRMLDHLIISLQGKYSYNDMGRL